MAGSEDVAIELEHSIGFSAAVYNGIHWHPNRRDYVYPAGACVVICDFTDPHNQHFLRGHDNIVSCVALSKSGRLVASGQVGDNADVIVWDFETRELLYRFEEHDFGVGCLAFSDDERLLVTCGNAKDKSMIVWDLSTGYIVGRCTQDPLPSLSVKFGGMVKNVKRRETDQYQLATAGNRHIKFWALDPKSGSLASTQVTTSSAFNRDFTCLLFTTDREWLYGGTSSGDVACINVKSAVLQHSVYACSNGVTSLAEVAIGDHSGVAVAGGDGSITIWSGYGKDLVDFCRINLQGGVRSMSPSPDRTELLLGTMQGFVRKALVGTTPGSRRADDTLLVCRTHATVAAKLSDGVGVGAGSAVSSVGGGGVGEELVKGVGMHLAGVAGVAYPASESDRFATAGDDNTVRVWDAGDYSSPVHVAVKGAGHPSGVQFSTDVLLSGWEDGAIRCHHADTGEQLWVLADSHRGGVSALKLSNNRRFALSGGVNGAVRVWEMRSRELVSDLKEHVSEVTQLLLYDDDIHALSCSRDKSFLAWDLRRETRISSHTQRMGGIHSIALTRDQSLIITAGQEKKLTYWDLREENPVQVIDPAHGSGEATCISVAAGSDLMVTGGTDHVVRLWDIRMGKTLMEGVGHSGKVRGISFSPDDKQVVSVGSDGCVLVWNVYQ